MKKDSRDLNEQQAEAVKHGNGPLLIIAGAGTGKTTVITKRIQHLILEKKVPPSNILALTFTEKAAAEMETRIDQILPYGYTQMWIETFHAFCDRILRQEAVNIGLTPNFELLKEAESLLFLRKNIFEFELDYFRPLGNPMKFLQGMLQHFSRLKDDDISPEQYLEYASRVAKGVNYAAEKPLPLIKEKAKSENSNTDEARRIMELAKAYKKYEELKVKAGVMDFSDLISNTLKILRTRNNILKEYQRMFQYILVDEFQDTNYAQNEMSILLAGKNQNITVVADDDQSIYRWRGAAISNVMQFRSHFPKTKIVTLTRNYRSTQNILDSAYGLIQNNNPDRLEVKENIDKKLVSSRGVRGDEIGFIYTNRGDDEAEEVAKMIREEVKKNNRAYSDFAILVRANDHSVPFQRSLERLKIPYQFLGPGHLFQQEEIKDLVAYFHALANFEDMSSLYRVITLPIFDIEARDVASLLNMAKRKNLQLFEAMEQVGDSGLTDSGKEKITRITEMMKRHLAKVPRETAGQILYYFFEDSGLLGHYLDPRSKRTEREAQNIAMFFDKLQSYAASHTDASVFAVTDWIDLSMELGESPLSADVDWTRNNAVNILTIHSSKGLEFPFVFVVNLVTARFPSRDRKEQIPVPADIIREVLPSGDENLQEERRLFYVAITRAKDKLVLSASRFYGDGKRERKISPFVIETLGEALVQKKAQKQLAQPQGQQLALLDFFNTKMDAGKIENETSELAKPKLTYISYSQLQTFLMCPLHYKLRYILNVPTTPSPALSYGVSVHSSLRDFTLLVKNGEKINTDQMKEILKKNWVSAGYSSRLHEEQTYAQAEKMLLEFSEKIIVESPKIVSVELPFNFWLNPSAGSGQASSAQYSTPRSQGLKVGGRIDRIDRLEDGKIEIVDYKTGQNVPSEKKVKEDFQLTFYALAAVEVKDQILSKTPDQIVLTLNYLEAGKKLSTTRSKEELEDGKKRIFELVDEISNSDFRCSGGMFCKTCEYRMVCQSRTN
jgi:DNA helicase-2/ATP-dependent DNA helicase PcrA